MRKKLILPILGAFLLGGTLLGASKVLAQDETSSVTTLVQRMAQRFGLNESDVQSVFDEFHEERHTEMQANFKEKLTQAVTEGKITEEQKSAILAKFQEMHTNQPDPLAFKDMTEEERQAEMENKRTEMQSWADSIGIDLQTLHELIGRGGGHGGRMWMM